MPPGNKYRKPWHIKCADFEPFESTALSFVLLAVVPNLLALLAREGTADAQKVATRLNDASAQYRYEAVKRLGALKVPLAEATTKRLSNLVLDDPYEEIRAEAVLALDACDPQGRAGWDRLMADYMANFWSDPLPKEGYAYFLHRDRTERRHWIQMTLRALGEQGRTRLERDFSKMVVDGVRLRIAINLATDLRWRIEGLLKAGLEVAQGGPQPRTSPWESGSGVPVNTTGTRCLPDYFAAIDAASDPAAAQILMERYKDSWTLYPTFARNLPPERLLAWIEPIALASSHPSNRPRIFSAWKAIGPAALPSMERVRAAMAGKAATDKLAEEYAKAIEETITALKEK